MVGGMVLLAVGGTAAAVKMSQKDAQRVEEHTGASVEELTEEELVAAMKELGIQSIQLTDEDQAALITDAGTAPPVEPAAAAPPRPSPPPPPPPEPSYLDELERLAALRDQGIITDEDFEAKKRQLLGL
jgi:hypothetical protein